MNPKHRRVTPGFGQAHQDESQPPVSAVAATYEEPTEVIETSRATHAAIYEAVRDRDPQRASQAMEAHLEETRAELNELIFGER